MASLNYKHKQMSTMLLLLIEMMNKTSSCNKENHPLPGQLGLR